MIEVFVYQFKSGFVNPTENHCAFLVRLGTNKKTGETTRERLPIVFFAATDAEAARKARDWWDTETAKAEAMAERGRELGKNRRRAGA
jgi:hypothetical protein